MKCFYCDKEIGEDKWIIVALDKPYVNLPVHSPGCADILEGYGAQKYLEENIKRVYEYAEAHSIKNKK